VTRLKMVAAHPCIALFDEMNTIKGAKDASRSAGPTKFILVKTMPSRSPELKVTRGDRAAQDGRPAGPQPCAGPVIRNRSESLAPAGQAVGSASCDTRRPAGPARGLQRWTGMICPGANGYFKSFGRACRAWAPVGGR
jgi:hypothetical protein